jgi:hypothetical protein
MSKGYHHHDYQSGYKSEWYDQIKKEFNTRSAGNEYKSITKTFELTDCLDRNDDPDKRIATSCKKDAVFEKINLLGVFSDQEPYNTRPSTNPNLPKKENEDWGQINHGLYAYIAEEDDAIVVSFRGSVDLP